MPSRQTTAFLAFPFLCLPFLSVAQDRDMANTVESFKGLSGQVQSQIPGMGGAGILGSILNRKQKIDGAGQTEIKLSQEQQDYLDKQKKAKERATAKAVPARSRQAATHRAVAKTTKPLLADAAQIAAPVQPTINFVDTESLNTITPGAQREVVLAGLGKPRQTTKILGLDDGVHETLVYYLDARHKASIRMVDGKVESIIR